MGTPTPEDSHLIRAGAGTVLVLEHGRWGCFALGGDKEGGGKEKAEVFGWYMVPMEHKMVDMSILLRAGATVEAVDKSGKIVEDTYWCTCHEVCAMGLAMWCSSMCNKGCNKVPYRTPYRVIRCAIRYLVALGTLHHLIAFHLILLCPVAPVAFFIRCCTHAPIFNNLLLSSRVTVVQWPRLDLVQAPEAPDVAGSKVGHVAPAAEAFAGVGEEWFLLGPPTVFEATGFGNEVTLPGQAPTTKTHWCRSFKLKVRQGGLETVKACIHPPRRL